MAFVRVHLYLVGRFIVAHGVLLCCFSTGEKEEQEKKAKKAEKQKAKVESITKVGKVGNQIKKKAFKVGKKRRKLSATTKAKAAQAIAMEIEK